ncbi:MAG: hypothetical protein DWQ37_11130 [Planctomycetota bacterium]|nr:MAG: hypothetical protein DWQ37_11130 [Planctomycetota bacterium]
MYQAYWGLTRSPFRGHLDPGSFYQGATQEEAIARLHFLVDEQRTLGLLLGSAGSGKSLVLEVFANGLGTIQRQPALLSLVGVDRREFLWRLIREFGIESTASAGAFPLCRTLEDHLLANRHQQITTVLLLDDADDAHCDVLEEIARLVHFNHSRKAGLTIVLAGRTRRLGRLGEKLLELAELRIDLECWDLDDTAAFLKQSLSRAGRSTPIFGESAVRRLHELSGGVPRRITQMADLALLGGAGSNLSQIEADMIELVYDELGVVATAPQAESTP